LTITAANSGICSIGADEYRVSSFCSLLSYCPGLIFTIEQQNMFCTLVLRSAAVAGGDDEMNPPTAQMPERCRQA